MPSPSHPYSQRPVPPSQRPVPSSQRPPSQRPVPYSQKPYSQSPSSQSPTPYSHAPYSAHPSQSLTPSHRPHITPIRKADMIPPTPWKENTEVSSIELVGALGMCILFAIILRYIRTESVKTKVKVKDEGFSVHGYPQKIKTAYNTVNLIHRSSNNLGDASPV